MEQQLELSNKLRVSKDGLQERKVAVWEDVYEKPEQKIDFSYKIEQIIGGTITGLLFILILLK